VPRAERPRLLVRSGTEDKYRFDEASYLFATVARDNGVEVELVLEPGGHDWDYWSRTTGEVVAWAVRALEARAATEATAATVPPTASGGHDRIGVRANPDRVPLRSASPLQRVRANPDRVPLRP
jgi:hypothetical protein